MNTFIELFALLGPFVVAALTIPVMNGIRSAVGVINTAPALVKRLIVIVIAFGLAKLSVLAGVALPENLEGITVENLEALGAAALAFAFHAGDKAGATA